MPGDRVAEVTGYGLANVDRALFVDGHTTALSLDPFGNLWVGDDPSDGAFNFSGRLWRIPATRVASIP